MSSRRLKIFFYSLLVIYVLGMMLQTPGFRNPNARIFPYLFGTTVLILGIIALSSVISPTWFDRITPDTDSGPEMDSREGGNLNILTIVLVGTFPVAVYLLGFFLVIPLYVFMLVLHIRGSLIEGILISAVITVGWWLIFVRLLHVVFFDGILF